MSQRQPDEIAITGMGMVTCLGLDVAGTWTQMIAGACGIGPSTAMQSRPNPDKGYGQAAELPDDELAGRPREVRYLRRAILEAVTQAGLIGADGTWRVAPERIGVVLGTTLHGMPAAGRFCRDGQAESLRTFLAGSTLSLATDGLPIAGRAVTTCAACASGVMALGLATTLLRNGDLDVVLAGGYDPVSEYAYGGFNSLRLIAQSTQQPFSRHRQGLKLAEGYGMVVMERERDVVNRAQEPLAKLLACTASADAHHLSQPHPEGKGAASAIRAAITEAGITPDALAMITAHATATPDNDRAEAAAYVAALGDALGSIPMTAMKSHLGHTLGAAGAVEFILTIQALREGMVPALANVQAEDIEFDALKVITESPAVIHGSHALVTSLGFGGSNACAIVAVDKDTHSDELSGVSVAENVGVTERRDQELGSEREPVITGIGVVYPGAVGNDAFLNMMRSGAPTDAFSPDPDELSPLLNTRRVRRMSEYVKLSLAATTIACRDAGVDSVTDFDGVLAALTGTTHGSAEFSNGYYRGLLRDGVDFANPLLFSEGVPNAGSAHLSMMLGLTGPCQTLIGTRTVGLDALAMAASRIRLGEWDAAIIGAAEEQSDLVREVYTACGLHCTDQPASPFARPDGFICSAGAATLFVESRASAMRRGAKILASIESWDYAAWQGEQRESKARRLAAMLVRNNHAEHLISSANGTWIDRVEQLAIRSASRELGSEFVVSTTAPRLHETFSASPILAIAATLLSGGCLGMNATGLDAIEGMRPASPSEKIDRFGVISSDYNAGASAVWLSR